MNRHRYFEIGGILGFASLECFIGWRASPLLAHDSGWMIAGAAVLLGFISADFASGLIHWGFDRYGTVDTPVVGPNFIAPFREHHVDPKGITRHDFVETNGNNCIATLLVLVPVALINPAWGPWSLAISVWSASLCLFVMGTNQFHKWAHQDDAPAYVRWLMKARLILETQHHEIHHTPPFERYYCITSGWLNPILDYIGFFKRTEDLIWKLTGVRGGVDDQRTLAGKR